MSVIKGVEYNENGVPVKCLFCRIHRRELPGTIVFEDSEFVVFKTIAPISPTLHLLVTPREHVSNSSELSGKRDAEMVERMVAVGKSCLGEEYAPNAGFYFSVPPWYVI